MGLADAVSGLLTDEWQRMQTGLGNLDPVRAEANRIASGRRPVMEGEARTVNIPGWDDVVKIGAPVPVTGDELSQYARATRAGKPSGLSAELDAAAARKIAQLERMRTSAQPDYMQAWGSILTALDNVQDLASTIATVGRLTVWALPRAADVLGYLSPAARAAALKLLGGAAARMLPGVGAVLLISDLLNLLSLFGMAASPLYAWICGGPKAALAAGFPTAVFKGGRKKLMGTMATANPLGRKARAARALKAASGRIGVGALVEVAQTTEQLFGYGLSFGAVVGMLAETASAVELASRGVPVQINAPLSYEKAGNAFAANLQNLATGDLYGIRAASAAAAAAPGIAGVQQHFTDDEHVLTMLVLTHACAELRRVTKGVDLDDVLGAVMDDVVSPTRVYNSATVAGAGLVGLDLAQPAKWWLPGFPTEARIADLVDYANVAVPRAVRDFLTPRRDHAAGQLFATLTSQLAEHLWLLVLDDPEGLRWKMTPDWHLVHDLALDGYLLNNWNDPEALWRLWQEARAYHAAHDEHTPPADWWRERTRHHGLDLIPTLPPTASWPAAWTETGAPTP